ncbi:fucolectin-5-like [Garra rufa]|uniref:fucolectin-5-like n=1 Tax=Garra rufa TaxID=137080 RepID=UPI003CCEE4B2
MTAGSQSANLAIDGGKDSSTSSSTCATTYKQSRPWWRLDLQAAYRVSTVVVTYRDDSVPGQTKDIQVKLGNSLWNNGNSNPRCTVISSDSAANSFIYSCSNQEGRYVNVFHNDWWDFLSVCEVDVYETGDRT